MAHLPGGARDRQSRRANRGKTSVGVMAGGKRAEGPRSGPHLHACKPGQNVQSQAYQWRSIESFASMFHCRILSRAWNRNVSAVIGHWRHISLAVCAIENYVLPAAAWAGCRAGREGRSIGRRGQADRMPPAHEKTPYPGIAPRQGARKWLLIFGYFRSDSLGNAPTQAACTALAAR